MVGEFVFAAIGPYYGGSIQSILQQWEQIGVFAYLLPFLMIFALIFVILNSIKIFKDNRGVNAVIAIAVGLMALQFQFVPVFFSEIFPRLGVGLAVILALLILVGMFVDPNKPGIMYVLLGIAAVTFVVVLYNTAGELGWSLGYTFQQYFGEIVALIILLVGIGVVVGATNRVAPGPSYNAAGWHSPP